MVKRFKPVVMINKLAHKIIIFTGGVASGKSTIKKNTIEILKKTNTAYYEISGINDLYIPFAIKEGLLKEEKVFNRVEATVLMQKLYAKFGMTLGSRLLYDFLNSKPADTLYLIDSKRNPEGIEELKELFFNILIIGSCAYLTERVARYTARNRDFDLTSGATQAPISVFKNEENIFHVTKSVAISDLIIENHELLPHEIEVDIFDALLNKGFIGQTKQQNNVIPLPRRGEFHTTKESVLQQTDIPPILDNFLQTNREKNIFVIQGGNRYITSYLHANLAPSLHNIKLLDIGKVKLNVVCNTLLSVSERVSPLSSKQIELIVQEFKSLPAVKQITIESLVIKNGFISLVDYLTYASLAEVINIFGDFTISTPFSYPADDRKITKEFAAIPEHFQQTVSALNEGKILQILLSNTYFHSTLTDTARATVFIDDVFYRGRTYYTLCILTHLFGSKETTWEMHTLCADRVSKHISTNKIVVYRKNLLYPFENSIITEQGYWEEKDTNFLFRDLQLYHNYLKAIQENKSDPTAIIQTWARHLEEIANRISRTSISKITLKILVSMYLFTKAHKLTLHPTAILDQRAKGLGYCLPYVQLLSVWINQEEPRWKRQQYKDKITLGIKTLITADQGSLKELFTTASDFYLEHQELLDYKSLTELYAK